MSKIFLAAITAAALLAFAGIANAQGTGTGPGLNGTASNQCWDMSSNMVRDKNQTNASGASGNTDSTVGSTSSKRPMGTGAVGAGGPTTGAAPSSGASARPAGLPDC